MKHVNDMQGFVGTRRTRGRSLAPSKFANRFARCEDGSSIMPMSLVTILMIVAFVGIAMDAMHADLDRTKMQNTLDRAVLAASDLQNMRDPETVVEDYFEAMGVKGTLQGVTVENSLTRRSVSGSAEQWTGATVAPWYNALLLTGKENEGIRFDGFKTVNTATAIEERQKVEISLVLDISASMRTRDKIGDLRRAATEFVETVMAEDDGRVSVSLVPYSEHVAIGEEFMQHMNINWRHGYSFCVEFPDSEFNSAGLNVSQEYEQMQHYQWSFYGYNHPDNLRYTVCPQYNHEQVVPFSLDRDALIDSIARLEPHSGTSIFLGMKWGTALLDPSVQSIIQAMADDGDVSAQAVGRPVAYDDPETIKTVVLMTDGENNNSHRIADRYYRAPGHYSFWARNNFSEYLITRVSPSQMGSWFYQKYNTAQGDALLRNICQAAKDQGIIVWTIGFDTADVDTDEMQDCASSPSHYFEVDENSIDDAFRAIARTVTQLRLTQ